MGFSLSSLAGGPGGGIIGSLFGGGGSQYASQNRQNVATQDVLAGDRPYYAQQLRQLYDDPSAFLSKIPGYQFQMEQGEEAIKRNAGATGFLGSGNISADLLKYSQGLASNTLNQYTTILAGLAESGDPRYAALMNEGSASQIAGNQAMGGNALGFLSSMFGGKGNGTNGSSAGGWLSKLFGGGGGGSASSFGSDWSFGDTSGASSFDSNGLFDSGGMDLTGGSGFDLSGG